MNVQSFSTSYDFLGALHLKIDVYKKANGLRRQNELSSGTKTSKLRLYLVISLSFLMLYLFFSSSLLLMTYLSEAR